MLRLQSHAATGGSSGGEANELRLLVFDWRRREQRELNLQPPAILLSRMPPNPFPPLRALGLCRVRYLAQAPDELRLELAKSEDDAKEFCAAVAVNGSHRCNRSAHLQDWGPEPHWVAVVRPGLSRTISSLATRTPG